MSVTHYIALRYLKANQENRFFSWITILSVVGLAIGVAALIVVISVINGFEFELRERFLHANAHVMAYRYPGGMAQPEKWITRIKKDFKDVVKGISPFVHYETMVKKDNFMHGVLVRGISPKKRAFVQNLNKVIMPPSALDSLQQEIDIVASNHPLPTEQHVILGIGLARLLDAKVGDNVYLISPKSGKTTEMLRYKIIGTYNSGLKFYDNRIVVMSIPAAQNLFKMNKIVTGLEIGLIDASISVEVVKKMQNRYSLSFREWQSFNKPLFEAMKKERAVITLIVAIIVVVAAFNILTTIFVSVSQKQKDISILKALGAQHKQILGLFVNQGVYIGVLGGVLGIVLALIISFIIEKYKFIDLPDPYFIKHLPIHYSPSVYLTISVSAIVICILASLYPAIIATKVTPTDGFRENHDMQ